MTMFLAHILLVVSLILSRCVLPSTSEFVRVEQISDPYDHSEGPHWNDIEKALYFVDIAGFGVHRYEPQKNLHTSITLNDTVGVVVPIEGAEGKFVIGYGKDIAELSWDGESERHSVTRLLRVDGDKPGNRFNDGKADINGNLWIGTMGEEKPIGNVKMNQGSLFKLNTNCNVTKIISPVSISNGIAWNSENNIMYYIDSPTRKIDIFDYDEAKGEISNRRTFFDFEKNGVTGVPDGMTIDIENNLWVACWGGSKVIQVCGGRGKLLRSVRLPAERVTSVAFGGGDLSTLYVTTMRAGLSPERLAEQPSAGALFALTGLGVTGTLANHVRLPCLHPLLS